MAFISISRLVTDSILEFVFSKDNQIKPQAYLLPLIQLFLNHYKREQKYY